MYIIFVQNVWICRKINCVELRKFNGKLCTLNVRNVQICKEIEYTELRKLKKKLCTLYLHRMSGFAKKLNVQNSINSTENSVHYTYGMFGFKEKLIAIVAQIQLEIVCIIRTECLNL